MKKIGRIFIILVLFYAVYYSWLVINSVFFGTPINPSLPNKNRSTVSINQVTYFVEIANTDDKRALGLSGRDGLDADSGMVFLFEQKNHHAFWMKDMEFPIEFIRGMTSDGNRSVCLEVTGRGRLFLFYAKSPVEALRVREVLGVVVPQFKGLRPW